MNDLERQLGVSYPTARPRFDELLGRLGDALAPEAVDPVPPPRPTRRGRRPT